MPLVITIGSITNTEVALAVFSSGVTSFFVEPCISQSLNLNFGSHSINKSIAKSRACSYALNSAKSKSFKIKNSACVNVLSCAFLTNSFILSN